MTEMQQQLDYADGVADWFLEIAERHCERGDFERALQCSQIAATIFCRQSRTLVSPRLEAILQRVGHALVLETPTEAARRPGSVCLHVLDEALPAGGLTAMAIRWMRNDHSDRIHSVALLSQHVPIPDELVEIVRNKGGTLHKVDPDASLMSRVQWLRKLAHDSASAVILHIGVTDVVCGVAFGREGGPPVMLVNHAAHIFWTGASIPDLAVNCRGSALEGIWTATHRGLKWAAVPIPLREPASHTLGDSDHPRRKRKAKESLGLPPDCTVILTVGAAFKYSPVDGLDFLSVLESTLSEAHNVVLLAAGFRIDSRWSGAAQRVGGRIKVLGVVTQSELAKLHEAADVYLEGFPFGSTTALLEAGLKGLPVVLPPAVCPPPFTSDGLALDNVLNRPASVEAYKAEILRLCWSPSERTSRGQAIQRAIHQHHCGEGWRHHLEQALSGLPALHTVRRSIRPVPTPRSLHEYWAAFVSTVDSSYAETLEHTVTRALSLGLRPRLTKGAAQVCRDFKSLRCHRTIPLPLLVFLCNFLLPVLPIALAAKTFRSCSFLCRKSLLTRLRRKWGGLFGRAGMGRSWYEDYRHARG